MKTINATRHYYFLLALALLIGLPVSAQVVPAPTKAPPAPTPPQVTRLTVAPDGSGDYRTIQEAVHAVRDWSEVPVTIVVRSGTYREKLVVPSNKIRVRLLGESRENTIISYDDYSGKNGITTYTSHSVLVQGNDFSAENITFQNSAGPVGQAVALHVEGDRATFRNCRIVGNQDTLFPAVESSRQYYVNCYIEGTTDFIFGAATVVFDHCTLHSKKNSYVTAASTSEHQKFGFVFLNCKLTADSVAQKVHLGRPWRSHARAVFLNTEMGPHIVPAGWHNWSKPENEKTAYYAEYKSIGPGANATARVAWSHQLTVKEAKQYTLKTIFAGGDGWQPASK